MISRSIFGFELAIELIFSRSSVDSEHVGRLRKAAIDHYTAASPVALLNCHNKTDWLGTAAARVGFAFDKPLVFVKGGGAWMHNNNEVSFFAPPARSDGVVQTKTGWMFGTGVE